MGSAVGDWRLTGCAGQDSEILSRSTNSLTPACFGRPWRAASGRRGCISGSMPSNLTVVTCSLVSVCAVFQWLDAAHSLLDSSRVITLRKTPNWVDFLKPSSGHAERCYSAHGYVFQLLFRLVFRKKKKK